MKDLLTEHQLAEYLGYSGSESIKKRRTRGQSLPPCIQVDGMKGRRYRMKDVDKWLSKFSSSSARLGRPKKIKQQESQS